MENGGAGDGGSPPGVAAMGFRADAHPRLIRLTVQDHHRLLDALRKCAAIAQSIASSVSTSPQTSAQPIGTEKKPSLSEDKIRLIESFARAVQAMEQVTDRQGRICSTQDAIVGDVSVLAPPAVTSDSRPKPPRVTQSPVVTRDSGVTQNTVVTRDADDTQNAVVTRDAECRRRRRSAHAAAHLTRSNTSVALRRQRSNLRKGRRCPHCCGCFHDPIVADASVPPPQEAVTCDSRRKPSRVTRNAVVSRDAECRRLRSAHLTRSNTSVALRRQRSKRRKDREHRISKRTPCGVFKVILKKRNGESEHCKPLASRALNDRGEHTVDHTQKPVRSRNTNPRTPLRILNSKPLKPPYIQNKKKRVKEIKSSLEKYLTDERDRNEKNRFSFGMLVNNKNLKEKIMAPKVGMLGIRMTVADPFGEDSFEREQRNNEMDELYARLTRRDKTNTLFKKAARDHTNHTHQFQVLML